MKKGVFVTSATDGFIKFWEPLENMAIATLDESEHRLGIDYIIPVVGQKEINIFYVMGKMLKCFSIKSLKTVTLVRSEKKITAICLNEI